jgi:hypothetical protein
LWLRCLPLNQGIVDPTPTGIPTKISYMTPVLVSSRKRTSVTLYKLHKLVTQTSLKRYVCTQILLEKQLKQCLCVLIRVLYCPTYLPDGPLGLSFFIFHETQSSSDSKYIASLLASRGSDLYWSCCIHLKIYNMYIH